MVGLSGAVNDSLSRDHANLGVGLYGGRTWGIGPTITELAGDYALGDSLSPSRDLSRFFSLFMM